MFDKEFLKQLTILYVEDEDLARTQLAKILNRLFDKVIEAKNGLEGFELYQEYKLNDKKIDLILSDINMPKMNGIEMLEKIREHDSEIPIIYTTARSETEYLLKAISLNANHYAIKPIDKEDVILRIQKVCEKKYYEELIKQKSQELKEYLSIINNVAIISKMDENGNIIFANNLLLDSTSYSKDEILSKNFNELLSPQIDKTLLEQLWIDIKDNKVWKNDLKYIDKKQNVFFIKSTIFKTKTENKNEYINIGFISTDEVNERRDFHKKLIQNMKEKNIQSAQIQDELELVNEQKAQYEGLLINLQNELKKEKQKQVDVSSQVKYYENEILNVDDRIVKNLKLKNNEIDDLKNAIKDMKKEKEDSSRNIQKLSKELLDSKIEIEELYDKLKIKEKRVTNLSELVEFRENQLRKFDETLLEE